MKTKFSRFFALMMVVVVALCLGGCANEKKVEATPTPVPVAETVEETVAETVETVDEAVTETVEAVEETVTETVEAVEETVTETVEAVEETVAETVTETVEAVEETVAETVEAVAETVTETVETVEETVTETVETVEETVTETVEAVEETVTETVEAVEETVAEAVAVKTYAEYVAAALDTPVEVETYVQAKQSWWDNKGTFYTQNEEGAYFIYEMAISEEDYNKLVPGTKILVKGYKAEWAGEVEIVDATFEILEGEYIAQPKVVTSLLGSDELINYQNQLVSFNSVKVEKVEYKNGEPGDDIYVTISYDGNNYDFCVERYLTGPETEVYQTVGTLNVGDVVDIEGFLYWYNGVNTHITKVNVVAAAVVEETVAETVETVEEAVTETVEAVEEAVAAKTYADYAAAALDTPVEVETYVQAKQSWWDNKGTFYTQNEEGAYFIYEMAISEEDYNKLVPGTKILVKGYKAEWAGEVEVVDATFEILEGEYIAEAKDLTDKLASEELINYQNQFAAFKGMTVDAIEYKNGEPGDDIYVTLSKDGAQYSFCVERYLTGPETEVYQTIGTLKAGDVVDVEGFVYWYNGVNTHITSVAVAAAE